MWPPRSLTACSSLPPEGAGLAWGGPALRPWPPRSRTACSSLPPEGAGLAWGGPALRPWPPRSLTACSSLPPEGAGLAWGGPALRPWPPRSRTACRSLHLAGRRSPEASRLAPVQTCSSRFGAAGSSPEGAAAPAVWRSQSRGPCLNWEPRRTSPIFVAREWAAAPVARPFDRLRTGQGRSHGPCLNGSGCVLPLGLF
jgi:hypothetical protein